MKLQDQFANGGFAVAHGVYGNEELIRIRAAIEATDVASWCVWEKDLCACSRNFLNFATHPSVLGPVRELLGEEVVLWGGSYIKRVPGQVHLWHTDIESSPPEGGFVTVWIGLDGTSRESALKLVPQSHQFGKPLQQVIQESGKSRQTTTDEDVIAWAADLHEDHAGLVQPDVTNGDAIIFDGRLWHGSDNQSKELSRTALLFQFARADVPVRIPDFHQLDWPFRIRDYPLPPCIRVSGDGGSSPNSLAELPPLLDEKLPTLEAGVHTVGFEDEVPEGQAHHSQLLFEGRTANALIMHGHYSTLRPGESPHLPHAHVEEEVLMVLKGNATLCYDDGTGEVVDHPVSVGDGVYYPSFHRHTIRNNSNEPVVYIMFRWVGTGSEVRETLPLQRLRVEPLKGDEDDSFKMQECLRGSTHQLKGLESHVSTMLPGGGYEAHPDEHDVLILMFEGELETNGRNLGPGQVAWHPAGSLHDMWNRSEAPARYLVLEFHGDNCSGDYVSFSAPPEPRLKRIFRKRSPERILRNLRRLVGLK